MYKKIMVPLDGSKLAECVLPHVDGFVTGSQVETIIFVRVIEPTPNRYSAVGSTVGPENYETVRKNVERIEEESRSSAERYLKEVISRVKQDGIKYKVDVLVGKVADRLVDYVDANEIDLVLIATHGRSGISRWVRGSIADKVLRSSRAPVLMVRADGKMSGEKV
jgi:nucleotide-binding universal stress UspA family protein